MTKPEPLDHRHLPDYHRRAGEHELLDPEEPGEAVLEREIRRMKRESDEALAAYKRAFEERPHLGRATVPRRFP